MCECVYVLLCYWNIKISLQKMSRWNTQIQGRIHNIIWYFTILKLKRAKKKKKYEKSFSKRIELNEKTWTFKIVCSLLNTAELYFAGDSRCCCCFRCCVFFLRFFFLFWLNDRVMLCYYTYGLVERSMSRTSYFDGSIMKFHFLKKKHSFGQCFSIFCSRCSAHRKWWNFIFRKAETRQRKTQKNVKASFPNIVYHDYHLNC